MSWDYRPQFFSWFKPIWAPDKQARVFSKSVSISPRYSITKLSPRVQHTAEIVSACAAHRGDCLRAGMHTTPFFQNLKPLSWLQIYIAEIVRSVLHTMEDWLSGGMHTAEIVSVVCNTPWRQLCDQISRRNRNRIRKYFSLLIRGPAGFESWKKEVANLMTHSL